MSITIYTPNNEVVAPTDVNTQAGTVREDIPTHDEELALLVYEEDFRQAELAKFLASAKSREGEIWEEEEFRALDRAFNNALSWVSLSSTSQPNVTPTAVTVRVATRRLYFDEIHN